MKKEVWTVIYLVLTAIFTFCFLQIFAANEVTDYINAHPSKSASLITPANDSGASGYLKKLLSEMLGEVPANKLLPED